MFKNNWKFVILLVVALFVLGACGPSATPTEEAPPPETGAEPTEEEHMDEHEEEMAEATFPVRPGGFLEQAINGDFAGTEVTVDGPFADEDAVKFQQSYAAFEDLTGITVNYIGNKEFEGTISIRVDAGDAPDIADFPQPGLLANFVRQGRVVDVSTFIPDDWLDQQYNSSWLQMGTMEGTDGPITAGVWYRFNGKSLVWYPKDDFDAAGYTIPTTWDELIELSDMIVADGDAPWCVGIESGAATGWPATDWMEEVMLRTTSLENYDAWVAGTLPFSSPEVKNAAETLGEIWFNDDYVFGGTASIVSTNFGDAPAPMFEDPPKCWLHKQGNFITGFFPEGAEADVDYGFFYLPGIDDAYGKPFLVAGDIMAMFNDRPEVRAMMEYFTVPESAVGWLETGGALATHKTATPEMYGVDLERGIAALVSEATSFRFDGSDLMPGEVGAGSFWKGMTDWVSGAADLDTVLAEIDESWPTGVEGQVMEDTGEEMAVLACQVTDVGGIDDKSFNTTAWKGVEDAMDDLGVDGKYLESQQQTDYERNINAFIDEGCDLIVTVGFLLGDDTAAAAEANPDQKFAIVDFAYDPTIPNVQGHVFNTDEAAFLAGYAAAGVSQTGVVGTFGGIPIPPVTIFMDGFYYGVQHYNDVHGTNVAVLGWDPMTQEGLFTGNFESTDDGRTMGETLMDEGADIIMPVAGPVGLGTAAAAQERGGVYIVGVDNDWAIANPEFADIVLTSVLKNMDITVFDSIQQVIDGTFEGGLLVGTLENGGVGIAPFGSMAGMVSADLQAELDEAQAQIISGELDPSP